MKLWAIFIYLINSVNKDNTVDCIQCKVGATYFAFWRLIHYWVLQKDVAWHHKIQVLVCLCLTMVVLEPNAEQCLHTAPELHWALILPNIS